MDRKDPNSADCPFCGAPLRKQVSRVSEEVKCEYCGRLFTLPRRPESEAPRCPNHPEEFASGMCSKCGTSYCGDCLEPFHIERGIMDTNTMYLCPVCAKEKHVQQAEGTIFISFLFLFFSIIMALLAFWMGLIFAFLSTLVLAYGIRRRNRIARGLETPYDKRTTD